MTYEPLTRQRFEHEMNRAKIFQEFEKNKTEYWIGYQRGLRRAFHGENFGTTEEHNLWLAAIKSDDTMRRQRGEGYCDGLQGQQAIIRLKNQKQERIKCHSTVSHIEKRNI